MAHTHTVAQAIVEVEKAAVFHLSSPFFTGSLRTTWSRCGKQTCSTCKDGGRHGPYRQLVVRRKQKTVVKMVDAATLAKAEDAIMQRKRIESLLRALSVLHRAVLFGMADMPYPQLPEDDRWLVTRALKIGGTW